MDALKNYAVNKHLCDDGLWAICKSPLGGHGLFATQDIPPNTQILQEPALVMGPRSDPRCAPVCVACSQLTCLRPCSKGCHLPVCSDACEVSAAHQECSIMSRLGEVSLRVRVALVAPLRSVFLSSDDRAILQCLEKHCKSDHDALLKVLETLLSVEDLILVRTCCEVIDATAFEAPSIGGGSVRGIYPIAAMMNHSCVPNTRSSYTPAGVMLVHTTRPVTAGQEITNSYTCLTWGTQARRGHLQATKRFVCRCERCLDPTELGSRLMGLYCMKKGCAGVLLPGTEDHREPWRCTGCQVAVPAMRIAVIQKMVESTIAKVKEGGDPTNAYRILCKNSLVPSCNHHAVEFKFSLVRHFGHQISWSELTADELSLKVLICRQLILLLDVLNLGYCSQRDFLERELLKTTSELQKRKPL